LQSLKHYVADTHREFVSKLMVFACLLTKKSGIENNQVSRLDRSRSKMPDERRKKPGPPESFSCFKSLNDYDAFAGDKRRLESHPASLNKIEVIRLAARLKDLLLGRKVLSTRALTEKMRIALMKVLPERVVDNNGFKILHGTYPLFASRRHFLIRE